MSRKNKKSLVFQIKKELDSKLAIGQSKHLAKQNHTSNQYIYSWNTYRNYIKHCNYFAKWCKENYGCKTLEQCRPYINEWLSTRLHLSAYTQKLEACSLAKLYSCSTIDFIKTKTRLRKDITRSRYSVKSDKHFSEDNNKELVEFCRHTGLRRSELTYLLGNQLVKRTDNYYIFVKGKGGRTRYVPILNNNQSIINKMISAGNDRVFDKIPSDADIHSYRSEYAISIYRSYARKDIPKEDRYICRKDLKGVVYDKQAMKITSKALGHNRINVIAEHYLR